MNSTSLLQQRQAEDSAFSEAELLANLEDLRAQFQAFAYTVSHDLRAPLRHILAFTDLALEDLADQNLSQVQSHLGKVASSARLLGNQMDALMALIAAERASVTAAMLDLMPLIEAARQALERELAGRQLQWQVAQDMPAVWADARMVRQIFDCLLSNAVKFTRKVPEAQVEIIWEQQDSGFCTVLIRDNGVGFKASDQARLFQVFARLHSASEFEGVGTGLALARRLLQRQGGKIWAQGEPDRGCTVSFQLPLASSRQT
jgi:signal transduction histidine kinase